MYAIIEDSGKQFKVTSGEMIDIDRQPAEDLKTVTFDRVLLVSGEDNVKVGQPFVAGATVSADVVGPASGPKLEIVRYRKRKGFHKHTGHRQHFLRVKITGINA
jgi:large subunit ribosomal protein L21